MRALLDANVLIALLDPDHLHHLAATRWLAAHRAQGSASCPITQNRCVRVMTQPAYPNAAPAGDAAALLRDETSGRFVTLDRGVAPAVVPGATPKSLVVIA